jgi:hypothetical protein
LQQNPLFVSFMRVRWRLSAVAAVLVVGAVAAGAASNAPAPLYDPVFLNIGFVCRWDARCMDRQDDARKRALKYVRKKGPAAWRVQLCNRNAHRKGQRVDWIGFDNCIRNDVLRPAPAPVQVQRKRRAPIMAERGK